MVFNLIRAKILSHNRATNCPHSSLSWQAKISPYPMVPPKLRLRWQRLKRSHRDILPSPKSCRLCPLQRAIINQLPTRSRPSPNQFKIFPTNSWQQDLSRSSRRSWAISRMQCSTTRPCNRGRGCCPLSYSNSSKSNCSNNKRSNGAYPPSSSTSSRS